MRHYDAVYRCLELPEAAREVALGSVGLPFDGWTAGEDVGYGFPPALVPLWAKPDAVSYVGFWVREDLSLDSSLVVEFHAEAGILREAACDLDELWRRVLLERISMSEGIDERAITFAEAIGVPGAVLEALDQVSLATGDDPRGLLALRSPTDSLEPADSDNSFSVLDRLYPGPRASGPAFLAPSRRERFERAVATGDRSEAWLELNRSGWHFDELEGPLSRMSSEVGARCFAELARAWMRANPLKMGGY